MARLERGTVTGFYAKAAIDSIEREVLAIVVDLATGRVEEVAMRCQRIMRLVVATRTGDYRGIGLGHPEDYQAA